MIRINAITPTPEVLVAVFPTLDDFREWAEDLLIYDLHYWKDEFEQREYYEQCAVLRDLITEYEESCAVIEWMRANIKK